MSDRIVPGWVIALAVGVVVAAGLLVVAAPRLRDLANATPGPTVVRSVFPSAGGTPPPGSAGPPASALASIDPARLGTISFGGGPGSDRCSVTQPLPTGPGPIMTASSAQPLYVAAVLEHPVATSPALRLLILGENTPLDSITEPQDDSAPQCWERREPIGPLSAGNYLFVLLDGATQEATGILNVVGP